MKKYNIILLLSLLFFSCEEYLDKSPNLGIDEDVVFNNYTSVRGYLDNCYNCVMDFSKYDEQKLQRSHVGQLADEGANPYIVTSGQFITYLPVILNKGNWLGQNSAAEVGWGTANVGTHAGLVIPNAFYALRIANRVIEKVPTMSSLTEEQKNGLLGQAFFFRAWFYFEVIRRVGGMPLIDHVFTSDEDFDVPRLTYQQSSDWAVEQLDEAIRLLPDEWTANETGRPIKASAYALKSMMELYSASPLMCNPIDKIEDHGYNIDRCKLTAQYAKEALDYIETTVAKHKMQEGNYSNIFYHSPNFVSDESLWYLNSTGLNRDGSADLPVFWQNVLTTGRTGNFGTAQVSVPQNMVDKYETINGYPVKLVGNQWITDDPTFNQSLPYENRDPRLGKSILVPGEQFGGNNTQKALNYICTWVGGYAIEPIAKADAAVLTRYQCKKWIWPECILSSTSDKSGYAKNYYNCIIIRTTQVWLDYAEAMNEAFGPTEKNGYQYSAVDAINKVRERVGMTPVRAEFTTSKEIFRERIRNERAVELLLENHRWFDIRRWMIAESLFNIPGDPYPIKGVNATPSNATSLVVLPGNKFTYELMSVTTEQRVFERKHYWYPIGKDEAERMVNVKQNPGW